MLVWNTQSSGFDPQHWGKKRQKEKFYHKTVINADNSVENCNYPLGITSGIPSASLPKYKTTLNTDPLPSPIALHANHVTQETGDRGVQDDLQKKILVNYEFSFACLISMEFIKSKI